MEVLKVLFLLRLLTLHFARSKASGNSDFEVHKTDVAHYQIIDTLKNFEDAVSGCADLDTSVPDSGFVPRLFRDDSREKAEGASSILKG